MDNFIDQQRLMQEFCLKLSDLLSDSARYYELIMAVGIKHPGETRHATALRYILQAESKGDNTAQEVSKDLPSLE